MNFLSESLGHFIFLDKFSFIKDHSVTLHPLQVRPLHSDHVDQPQAALLAGQAHHPHLPLNHLSRDVAEDFSANLLLRLTLPLLEFVESHFLVRRNGGNVILGRGLTESSLQLLAVSNVLKLAEAQDLPTHFFFLLFFLFLAGSEVSDEMD